MKMSLDNASGVNVVNSYEPGRVQIRDQVFTTSMIVLPKLLLPDWEPRQAASLRAVHFQPILQRRPEIVIVGTGETQVFPDAGVFAALMDLGIGFEVMHNSAACRTYNILLAEDRRAALALILADDAP
ncbi:MAG: Mth938-like domain-containing protein [Chromatiaceae bacterium]|jgi:uncharacterized protein|nr:Mth938-like domain-containing protein [Chromatiaceae bacterium]